MMIASPASSSPWVSRPSADSRRSASTIPKASIDQSMAAFPSSYAIIGTTELIASSSSLGDLRRLVLTKHAPQDIATLPDGDVVGQRRLERRGLRRLVARADFHDLHGVGVRGFETVDAHHHALAGFDPLLQSIGALGDAPLGPP